MSVVEESHLRRTLGPLMLWGLGVGYVISGMYFGWNLGLKEGGTLGLAISTLVIMVMYGTFTLGYTELACAYPRAGGAFIYGQKAYGDTFGFVAGLAQIIEFVFAPPAIAAAIGAYFNLFMPDVPVLAIAFTVYGIFTALNIFGVKAAASFELWITILAVLELLIFAGVALPSFQWSNMVQNSLPHGLRGILASVPFAIWFFLAIEGIANVAEETINPQRNVVIGFGSAMITLMVLCILVFVSAIGVGGWEAIVFPVGSTTPSDSPLPLALSRIVDTNHVLFHMLVTVGLFGLVASFHGIILAAGRATFEFGRVGFAPRVLGRIHPRFQTPAVALIVNMLVGWVALLTGKTAEIIIIACFGALLLYIVSSLSLFKLRRSDSRTERPFKVPLYPWTPLIALTIACAAFASMAAIYPTQGMIFLGILFFSTLSFKLILAKN